MTARGAREEAGAREPERHRHRDYEEKKYETVRACVHARDSEIKPERRMEGGREGGRQGGREAGREGGRERRVRDPASEQVPTCQDLVLLPMLPACLHSEWSADNL